MFRIIISLITVVSFCFLLIILNTLTPANAGPFGILAVLLFSYTSSLGIMTFFLFIMSNLLSRLSAILITGRPVVAINFRRSYHYSTIISVAPIILIGLQSVGGVGFYEILLVIVFLIIGVLYVSKKTR